MKRRKAGAMVLESSRSVLKHYNIHHPLKQRSIEERPSYIEVLSITLQYRAYEVGVYGYLVLDICRVSQYSDSVNVRVFFQSKTM